CRSARVVDRAAVMGSLGSRAWQRGLGDRASILPDEGDLLPDLAQEITARREQGSKGPGEEVARLGDGVEVLAIQAQVADGAVEVNDVEASAAVERPQAEVAVLEADEERVSRPGMHHHRAGAGEAVEGD